MVCNFIHSVNYKKEKNEMVRMHLRCKGVVVWSTVSLEIFFASCTPWVVPLLNTKSATSWGVKVHMKTCPAHGLNGSSLFSNIIKNVGQVNTDFYHIQ